MGCPWRGKSGIPSHSKHGLMIRSSNLYLLLFPQSLSRILFLRLKLSTWGDCWLQAFFREFEPKSRQTCSVSMAELQTALKTALKMEELLNLGKVRRASIWRTVFRVSCVAIPVIRGDRSCELPWLDLAHLRFKVVWFIIVIYLIWQRVKGWGSVVSVAPRSEIKQAGRVGRSLQITP